MNNKIKIKVLTNNLNELSLFLTKIILNLNI